MASLRDKTISGVFWSFLQRMGAQGIQLIVTIILARLLTPKAFGLIGMLTIFISLSQTLVQAGFSQALIQKKNADEEDFSSVFYINLLVSISVYLILFFAAPFIAKFYDQPLLTSLTRVLSIIFVINAFSYVQETRLKKEIKFKTLMYVHLPSTIVSGIVALSMAYKGYGVWSIVAQRLVMQFAYAVQIWIYSKWKPLFSFNKQKARGLFSFGSKLMITGILQTTFQNVYQVIIGKFFPVNMLGYYQNANSLVRTPVSTLSSVFASVTYPIFSSVQDDNRRLKEGLKKTVQQILFWICPIMVLAAVLATPLFSFVLTDKWLPAVPFFRLLCIVGIFSPLNAYNLNIVNVKGRSDITLKLDIVKKIIEITGIIIAIPFGIWALVGFQAGLSIIKFLINSHFSGRFINYSLRAQIKDILPIFSMSLIVGGLVFIYNEFISGWPDLLRVITGFMLGGGVYWLIAEWTHFPPYLYFVKIVQAKSQRFLKR